MMLSSSMGAMGVAIGIAIDEGIAKDIQETAAKENIVPSEIMRTQLQREFNKNNTAVSASVEITLEKYGFVTQPGANDPVAAQLHLTVATPDKNPLVVRYPEDFAKSKSLTIGTRPLETIKQDAAEINALFSAAATWLANYVANEL